MKIHKIGITAAVRRKLNQMRKNGIAVARYPTANGLLISPGQPSIRES